MQFKLFSRRFGRSTLQQALDRDSAADQIGTGTDETICQPPAASNADKPLFKRPAQPNAVFRIDLMGEWLKA